MKKQISHKSFIIAKSWPKKFGIDMGEINFFWIDGDYWQSNW
jgi:hypothetical protein